MTLTLRVGAEVWVEVKNHQGRFYVRHDGSLVDLIHRLQEGDYYVTPAPSTRSGARRGTRTRKNDSRS